MQFNCEFQSWTGIISLIRHSWYVDCICQSLAFQPPLCLTLELETVTGTNSTLTYYRPAPSSFILRNWEKVIAPLVVKYLKKKKVTKVVKKALPAAGSKRKIKPSKASSSQSVGNGNGSTKKIVLKRLANRRIQKLSHSAPLQPNGGSREQSPSSAEELENEERRREREYMIKYYFGEGLNLYYKGEYNRSILSFQTALELDPNHGLSLEYIQRAKARENMSNVY